MRDLKLGADGDLVVADGDLQLTYEDDGTSAALAQEATIRLRLFLGEWFLNEGLGLPYFEVVFVKNPNPSQIRALVRAELLRIKGMASVEAAELFYTGARAATLAFSGRATSGAAVAGTVGVG